jgi:hypothetical protein
MTMRIRKETKHWVCVGAALCTAWLGAFAAADKAKATSPSAPAKTATAEAGWRSLFDGKTLAGWAPSNFEGEGAVKVVENFKDNRAAIVIEPGVTLSGITTTKPSELPRMNYELTLEAMRISGGDFFCGLTLPVGNSACTFICGGWGGSLTGISSIDHADASDNETTSGLGFEDNKWYRIRVRVTEEKLEAWIDQEQLVDFEHKGRRISMRPGDIEKSQPLGIATYMTKAAVRDIRVRKL